MCGAQCITYQYALQMFDLYTGLPQGLDYLENPENENGHA